MPTPRPTRVPPTLLPTRLAVEALEAREVPSYGLGIALGLGGTGSDSAGGVAARSGGGVAVGVADGRLTPSRARTRRRRLRSGGPRP